jgi:hypothetical protein
VKRGSRKGRTLVAGTASPTPPATSPSAINHRAAEDGMSAQASARLRRRQRWVDRVQYPQAGLKGGAMRWIGFVFGLALLVFTAASVVTLLLIPRATANRLSSVVARGVLKSFNVLTSRIRDYARRDRVWAAGPPAFLIGVLTVWLTLSVFGWALFMWPFTNESFASTLRLSGSSVFTLGFDVPARAVPTAIVFPAAASGLVIVALQIAYLPSLYSAFNRRETLVTLLETEAGSPAWGPEILARYQLIRSASQLARLYDRWTEWAADLSESHTSYRTLIYFRSPEPLRSWLIALLAVLDAAALHLAICPHSVPAEARPLMRMGYLTLRKIALASGIAVDDDPQPGDPISLTRAEFDEAVRHVVDAGWTTERDNDEAWMHFRGWRVNYEAAAYGLAYHLDVVPALWSGPRRDTRAGMSPRRPVDRQPTG